MNLSEESEGHLSENEIRTTKEDGSPNNKRFSNYFLPSDGTMNSGSIPRAQLDDDPHKRSGVRPKMPLPAGGAGTIDRTRHDSGNHYYASAATLQRDRPRTMPYDGPRTIPEESNVPVPPPPSMYGHLMKRDGGLDPNDPMDIYAKRMNTFFMESSKKNAQKKQLEGLVAAIGFMGVILSTIVLVVYLAIQAPYIRRVIGPFYATDFHESREDELNDVRRLEPPTTNVLYGVELGAGIFVGIMMIVTDCLLSKSFSMIIHVIIS